MKSGDYEFYVVNLLVHHKSFEINVMIPPNMNEDEKQVELNLQVRKFLLNQTQIESIERIDNK